MKIQLFFSNDNTFTFPIFFFTERDMTRIRLYWRLLLVYGLIRTITATITTIDNFHLPLIGSPLSNSSSLHRFLHTYTPGVDIAKRTLLYTVTENNILAALDPHTGALGKVLNNIKEVVIMI